MIRFIKEKKYMRKIGLKVINYALNGSMENAVYFIKNAEGLKTLFSAFMKKGLKQKYLQKYNKNTTDEEGGNVKEETEDIISSMASLFLTLPPNSLELNRTVKKFVENSFEKVERLIELHKFYYQKIAFIQTEGNLTEEEEYLMKLDAGLFTLQFVDFLLIILASPVSLFHSDLSAHLFSLLKQHSVSSAEIQQIIDSFVLKLEENQKAERNNTEENEKQESAQPGKEARLPKGVIQQYTLEFLDKFRQMENNSNGN